VKLPVNSIIPPEKVTGYLLVPQTRGDKSGYLELAGYGPSDAGKLLSDLRRQLSLDAVPTKTNKFGQYYEIRGHLTGPNGVTLAVRTIAAKTTLLRLARNCCARLGGVFE
jgi:hypothetical protein